MDVFLLICVAGPVAELCALVLLIRNGRWRAYPSFFAYLVWLFIANSSILAASVYYPSIYPALYWQIDSIDVVLRFLVIWEVFHQTFPRNSGLHKTLSRGLGMIAASLLAFACGTFLVYQNLTGPRSIHLALDRSFAFVQALMILGTLVTARYYGVKYGRNVRGIALAFGAWVSISTATNAMADLTSSFLTYWYYLRPLSFVVMIGVWIWALWVYDPNPPIMERKAAELTQWTEDWNRAISVARTIIRP